MHSQDNAEQEFWAQVDKDGPLPSCAPHLGPCWVWIGQRDPDGYGFFYRLGPGIKSHRVAYEWLIGPIPLGCHIDHLCRLPSCVNPAHMEPVSIRENVLRGLGPTAQNARKTHCKRGHPFTPENTYQRKHGRECITCVRERYLRVSEDIVQRRRWAERRPRKR